MSQAVKECATVKHIADRTIATTVCSLILVTALLHAGETVPAQRPTARPQVALAGPWQYQFVNKPGDAPKGTWQQKIRCGSKMLPVVFPGTIRLPGGLENASKADTHVWGVWFQREVTVPADWKDRRVVLRIGRCLYGVAVYVNDSKAGELPGYGGEIDVTELLTPGKAATVRLYSGRLGKGLESMDLIAKAAADYCAERDPNGGWLSSPAGIFGTPEEFCLESQSPQVCVRDVWYQTFIRGGARIDPLITIWSATDRDDLSCRVRISEPDSGKVVLAKTFPTGRLPVGNSRRRTVLPAKAMKQWNILSPNLYVGQVSILDSDGNELERSEPIRFGLREFWAQGRLLYLNNYPICPSPAFYRPGTMDKLTAAGVTMVQDSFPSRFWFHQDRKQKALAIECDETGVLFSATGITHHDLNLADPDVLKDYITWAEHYYGRYKNHPSIVIYGLGINAPGNFNDFSPAKMGRTSNWGWANTGTTRSYLVGREIDPSRLYYFHGGPRGGDIGSANFYPNHTPIQEVEDNELSFEQAIKRLCLCR